MNAAHPATSRRSSIRRYAWSLTGLAVCLAVGVASFEYRWRAARSSILPAINKPGLLSDESVPLGATARQTQALAFEHVVPPVIDEDQPNLPISIPVLNE